MPSYTTSLRLVQPSDGDTNWGNTVNTGLTALVDTSIAGTATITMTAANYTLTNNNGAADEARAMFLVLSGTPGGSYNVIVPAVSKLYFVTNSTGSAQTVKTSAGTGISVPNGASMTLRCDGTNVVVAQNYFGSLTLGAALPVASGGTGSTSTTYCSLTTNVTGTLPVANGGTGVTASTGTGSVVLSNSPTLVTPALGTPASGNFSTGSFTWPTFNQNTTGTAAGLSATLAIASGGTGATTLAGANIPVTNVANTFTGQQSFTGSSSTLAAVLTDAAEVVTASATAATGTINYDITTQSILFYTSNASANWTVNFRASSGTSLNATMSTGQSVTVAFLVTQGSTAYYNSAVQVDGTTSGVTTRWQGGTAPAFGNASGVDAYSYTIIKIGAATFSVFASQTRFA